MVQLISVTGTRKGKILGAVARRSLYKSLVLRQHSPITGSKHTMMAGKRGYHNGDITQGVVSTSTFILLLPHMSVYCFCMAGAL